MYLIAPLDDNIKCTNHLFKSVIQLEDENFDKFLEKMSKSGEYADQTIILAAAIFLKRDIYSISARLISTDDFKPWFVFMHNFT